MSSFHLRPDVKFSDGTSLTSNDVKVSLDLARAGQRTVWKDNYKAIKDIQTPDPATVTINLIDPHAPLLSELAMFPAWIMQADMASASDVQGYDDSLAWASKGTGAYYTESWRKGDPVILKRNANYWKNTPAVDEVQIEYVPDDTTRVLKLQGGEVDVVDFVPFSQIDALNLQPGIKAMDFPIQQTTFVILNVTKPPLADLNVRQALNYATDKDAIIKTVFFGQAQPMNAPIPLGTYVDKESPTSGPGGQPHVVPVSFRYNAEEDTIDVGGHGFAQRKKYRDVQRNPRVAVVIDDLATVDPWRPRMIEIRGQADILPTGGEAIGPGFDPPIFRIRPRRIVSIGIDGDQPFSSNARSVS